MRTELLLLANSTKLRGRCLAGLHEDGSWLRPVSTQSGGEIHASSTTIAGRQLRPLDLIELDLVEQSPRPHQAENWTIDQQSIQRVSEARVEDVMEVLRGRASSVPAFAQSVKTYIREADFSAEDDPADSLALFEVADATILPRLTSTTPLIEFQVGREAWSLPLTDDLFWAEIGKRPTELGHAFVCVSVGEAFAPRYTDERRHYLLAAGVIPVGIL